MDLPEYPRVIYQNNPLNEVVCQLKFPPILKISEQKPVEFQEEIRKDYPFFESISPQFPSDITKIISPQLSGIFNNEISYIFKSEDEKWQLFLSKESITLSTKEYKRYEDFKERLLQIINILEKIYQPVFYTRIGFKYQDLIIRSQLNLNDVDWCELISEDIAREFYYPCLSKSLKHIIKNLVLEVSEIEEGYVNLNHGLVKIQNKENNEEEISYVIDADFYTEKRINKNDDIWKILDTFNRLARKFFRFSITDKLHRAMEPELCT